MVGIATLISRVTSASPIPPAAAISRWTSNLHRQQREADQQEQHGVQQFVHQVPELDHLLAGQVGHGEPGRPMPGQQARDHDGQRAGDVQRRGQAVGDGDQRQGDRQFQRRFVDQTQRAVGEIAGGQAQDDAAAGLGQEAPARSWWRWRRGRWPIPAVTAKITTATPSLNRLSPLTTASRPGGKPASLQQAADGDRVGGGQQSAQGEAPGQRHGAGEDRTRCRSHTARSPAARRAWPATGRSISAGAGCPYRHAGCRRTA